MILLRCDLFFCSEERGQLLGIGHRPPAGKAAADVSRGPAVDGPIPCVNGAREAISGSLLPFRAEQERQAGR